MPYLEHIPFLSTWRSLTYKNIFKLTLLLPSPIPILPFPNLSLFFNLLPLLPILTPSYSHLYLPASSFSFLAPFSISQPIPSHSYPIFISLLLSISDNLHLPTYPCFSYFHPYLPTYPYWPLNPQIIIRP